MYVYLGRAPPLVLLFYPRSVSGRSLEGAPPSSRAAGAAGTVLQWCEVGLES